VAVGIVLGLVVLGVAVFATYWTVSHRAAQEPPPRDERAEWFDHQERERLHEITVEFENPIPLQNMDSLAQFSDADLGDNREDGVL
jgi:hypothetical protein